jgi:hypothetical protein
MSGTKRNTTPACPAAASQVLAGYVPTDYGAGGGKREEGRKGPEDHARRTDQAGEDDMQYCAIRVPLT